MKRLKAGSALLIAAIIAAASPAQTNEELQRQFNELKAEVRSLRAENQALKTQVAPEEHGLSTEINRLSERIASGTNLRSCSSQITLGGEFRIRGYYANIDIVTFDGQAFGSETNDGTWVDQRVRLNFQYDFGCDVTAFAELQSHWAWGDGPEGPFFDWNFTRPEETPGAVGMYQAWLEFRNVFCNRCLSTRIGRQEVVLGNQFQFGNADWYNGIVHDAIRVDYQANCWGLTLLAAKLTTLDGDINQLPSYFTDHDDDELVSAYLTLGMLKNTEIDAYWIYINGHGGFAQNSGASFPVAFLYPLDHAYYHTFGARVGGTLPLICGLDYNVEGAIQTGETHNPGAELDTDGFTVEAELGLTIGKNSRFRVFARGLFATGGDDESAPYLINYPNRHSNTGFRARYGIADLIPMTNVETVQLGFHFDPACNFTLGATGLWATTEGDSDLSGAEDEYGTELDVWGEYRYSDRITLGAGVAVVWADEAGQALWGVTDDAQIVGYLQARLIF